MRILAFGLSLAAMVVAFTYSALAYTCTPTGGCTFNVQYVEPGTLTNGQPLTDLSGTTITYTIAVDGGTPSAPKTVTVPASRPSGGGAIDRVITEAGLVPPHTYTISATATATSTAYGTSAATAVGQKVMNHGVTPQPPGALTIQ